MVRHVILTVSRILLTDPILAAVFKHVERWIAYSCQYNIPIYPLAPATNLPNRARNLKQLGIGYIYRPESRINCKEFKVNPNIDIKVHCYQYM